MMGRDIGGSSADGPARDHREGRAAEMVRSTVAKSVQTSANWPVAHEMGEGRTRHRESRSEEAVR
jgi:hypothetical protein